MVFTAVWKIVAYIQSQTKCLFIGPHINRELKESNVGWIFSDHGISQDQREVN